MRVATSSLDLKRAASLSDALKILRDDPRTPLAGGTDLMVTLNFGTEKARRFLDLTAVDELRSIRADGDTLVIGAMASFTAINHSPLVAARLPILIDAGRQVGGVQIQNRGTLGGNIANGSPAGDSLPVLAAVDAVLVLRSASAERRVAFTEFYTGYRTSVMRPDELIVAVEVPRVDGKQWFRKVGTRAALAISKIVMAAVRAPDGSARIALGSVAPTVVRARKSEAALARAARAENSGSPAALNDAVQALTSEIAPIDDIRSTAAYRRRVTGNLLRRFWSETA